MAVFTVFGGTGFLGRRVVERLAAEGTLVRVAARHPQSSFAGSSERIVAVQADIRDETTVAHAVAGADGAVNAVSTYVEKGGVTYAAVHERGAATVAQECAQHGVSRFKGVCLSMAINRQDFFPEATPIRMGGN
jgi:uncharacterized protein YbjT (DUF2867 family)